MSPKKPQTTDEDAAKKQRVFPADFAEFVTTTAAGLGDGWTADADTKPHPGPSAYLTHPDGRRIGIKHLWRGEAVQTWALDVPPREFEEGDADAETYADSLKHLTPGIRYNVGVCFTNNPPAATTARIIRTRLLPAFDGRRPPLRAFPKKPSRRTAAAEKPPAAADATTSSESTQAADQPQPEKATAKTAVPARSPRRTAKKTQPAAKKTEPKKQLAAPRPKRTTATATKTAKANETKAKKKSQPTETTNN
ncbi:hypothetical protein [Streptomyces aurantiogriseus]|uniref:Uncharacterized protein n=1 Tax=Streptomyces aurantiogriseus TaxID=66870 RepID=A0A918C4S2_9ACTN|nr:hypothetical protein [Streptomyces aurantiogriseus]GGR06760.1 hypothetical protein GCM10010251_23170 [Streptomyces aurantiogriseus]